MVCTEETTQPSLPSKAAHISEVKTRPCALEALGVGGGVNAASRCKARRNGWGSGCMREVRACAAEVGFDYDYDTGCASVNL